MNKQINKKTAEPVRLNSKLSGNSFEKLRIANQLIEKAPIRIRLSQLKKNSKYVFEYELYPLQKQAENYKCYYQNNVSFNNF